MPKNKCENCHQRFDVTVAENYKTLCKSCFVETKKAEFISLQRKVERLEAENELLKLSRRGFGLYLNYERIGTRAFKP